MKKKLVSSWMGGKSAAAFVLLLAVCALAPCGRAAAFGSSPGNQEIADAFLYYYAPAGNADRARAASRMLFSAENGGKPAVDATIARIAVIRNWDNFDAVTQSKLAPYLGLTNRSANATTGCPSFVSEATGYRDSTHFRAVYTTSGAHAAASSFIDAVLAAAEYSYTYEVTTLGLQAPKYETGKTKMYIYICDLLGTSGYSLLGRTVTVTYNGSECASTGNPAYMELDNDYAGTGLHGLTVTEFMQVTMAHELLHAVQFGINCYSPSYWLLESNATWVEDEVYPSANDYVSQYLGTLFSNLDRSVDYFSFSDVQGYGEALFFRQITENELTPAFIPEIWNVFKTNCVNPASYSYCIYTESQLPIIEALLTNHGKSLKSVYENYNMSNYTKNYRDGGLAAFPTISPTTLSLASTDGVNTVTATLNHLAAKFYKVTLPSGNDVELTFTGASTSDWRVSLVKNLTAGGYSTSSVSLTSSAGTAYLQSSGANYGSAVLIVNNVSSTADSQKATVTAKLFPGAYTSTKTFSDATAGLGSTNVPVHTARIRVTSAATLSSISYSDGGSGQTGTTKTWYLFRDNDNNGGIDGNDTLVKQVTTTTGKTVAFTGMSESISANTDYNYVLLLSISRTLASTPGPVAGTAGGAKLSAMAGMLGLSLVFGFVAFPPARRRGKRALAGGVLAVMLCAILVSAFTAGCGGGGGGGGATAPSVTTSTVNLSLSPSNIVLTNNSGQVTLYGPTMTGPTITIQQ